MYITIDIIDTLRVYNIYDITKYGCVFLKLGESIIIRGNGSHSHTYIMGSLPLAHNAQHSLVIMPSGARRCINS